MTNEKRLIDANALVETIVNTPSEVAQSHTYNVLSSLAERQHEILNIIDEQPTVDAVDVGQYKSLLERYHDLRENFIDYYCSGCQNVATYCLNRCEECVDKWGYCKQYSDKCHGFNPAEIII
jgi:hypothetical protein